MGIELKTCENLPPAHDVAITAKDFGQTAYDHICVREHIDVDEVADTLVDYNTKIVLVGEVPYPLEVWCPEKWVGRKFCEECYEAFAPFKPPLQIVEFF
jgi:hypothetical protein